MTLLFTLCSYIVDYAFVIVLLKNLTTATTTTTTTILYFLVFQFLNFSVVGSVQ